MIYFLITENIKKEIKKTRRMNFIFVNGGTRDLVAVTLVQETFDFRKHSFLLQFGDTAINRYVYTVHI